MNTLSINYDNLSKNIVHEHNVIRSNPSIYIPILESYLKLFKGYTLHRPNGQQIVTNEGPKVYEEAIHYLMGLSPLNPLQRDERLDKACLDHVLDIGKNGISGHEGSDGKYFVDRIEKYAEWDGVIAENIDFMSSNAVDVMIGLIVDDGVPLRGHRKTIFSPDINFIGCGSGEHSVFGVVSVINYTGEIGDLHDSLLNYNEFLGNTAEKLYKKGLKEIKNTIQLTDKNAPDNAISVKSVVLERMVNNKRRIVIRKIYKLDDGSKKIIDKEGK
jgi:uncharacterized protein YkwD